MADLNSDAVDFGYLKLCHVNCQSLYAHFDEFVHFFRSKDFHVICMSETWLRPMISDSMVKLPGYTLYRCDRPDRMGGGVTFYLLNSLSARILRTSLASEYHKPEFIISEISGKHFANLLLAVVYRSPNCGYLQEFQQYFMDLQTNYKHSIILGDFTIDMNSQTYNSNQLNNFIRSSALCLTPFKSTHHLENSSTFLDLCIIDDFSKFVNFGQHGMAFLSAHDLIYITYSIKIERRRCRSITCRNLKQLNESDFLNELQMKDWATLFSTNSIDDKVNLLNSFLVDCLDIYAPEVRINVKNLLAPWLTTEIKDKMRQRDSAHRRWRRSGGEAAYGEFKERRNEVHNLIRTAKRNHYLTVFDNATRSANVWTKLKHLGLIKQNDLNKDFLFFVDELNDFFVNIDGSPGVTSLDFRVCNQVRCTFDDSDFHWKYVDPQLISKTISQIKSGGAGFDGITLKALRNLTELQHYRPIAILPVISKVIERIACKQIWDYLEESSLLDPCQSAYRRANSMQTCLIRVLDEFRESADERMVTLTVFFDLSKAFDRVQHHILISKLRTLNFSHSAISWISSYLEGRCQMVRDPLTRRLSSPASISMGVPQGSVLGPLLFILYLLDFADVLQYCKYSLYADDLLIYFHCKPKDIIEAIRRVNSDVARLAAWITKNQLVLNSKKTQAMLIGSSRYINALDLDSLPRITVEADDVRYSTQVKYLGVTLTNTLSWDKQVSDVTNKMHRTLYQLKICKNLLPTNLRQKLVMSLVYPHLDYCCCIFTDITAEQDLLLQRSLNVSVRFIF
ncbi:hypothetical protein DMN91_004691, partial [Ooceraea biroi]